MYTKVKIYYLCVYFKSKMNFKLKELCLIFVGFNICWNIQDSCISRLFGENVISQEMEYPIIKYLKKVIIKSIEKIV